jgi:hypothetical protein
MGQAENDYWDGLSLSNKIRPEANEAAGEKKCVSIVFCERRPAVKSRRAPDESGQAPQAKYSVSEASSQTILLLDSRVWRHGGA